MQDDITSLLNMLDENKGKAADSQKATAESEESSLVQSDADFKTAARLVTPAPPTRGQPPTHGTHTHVLSCRKAAVLPILTGYARGTDGVLTGYSRGTDGYSEVTLHAAGSRCVQDL